MKRMIVTLLVGLSVFLGLAGRLGSARAGAPAGTGEARLAPVFLQGLGGGGVSPLEGEMRHELPRDRALALIEDELRQEGLSPERGPWLLDGFTRDERAFLITPEDGTSPDAIVRHPFFFDFYLPAQRVGLRFVGPVDCGWLASGYFMSIDYFEYDLIGAIQEVREGLRGKSPVHAAFFYDPLPRGTDLDASWPERSAAQLQKQVRDFAHWLRREEAAGRLAPPAGAPVFGTGVPEERKAAVRQVAADVGAAPEVRLAAVEWLGVARDRAAVPLLLEQLDDSWSPIGAAVPEALAQIGSPEAVPPLIPRLLDSEQTARLLPVLDRLDPVWTTRPEARALLPQLARTPAESNQQPLADTLFRLALRLDPTWTVEHYLEAFRQGRFNYSSYTLEFLRACGPGEGPAILAALSSVDVNRIDWLDFARELARLDPHWQRHSAARRAVAARVRQLARPTGGWENSGGEVCCELEDNLLQLDLLDPGWRRRPEAKARLRTLAGVLQEKVAAEEWSPTDAVELAMVLRNRAGDNLVATWWLKEVDDWIFRDYFFRAAHNRRWKKSVPLLLTSFPAADEELRAEIMNLFQYLGALQAVAPTIRCGLRDPAVKVQRAAAIAAGERRLAAARLDLERVLATAEDGGLVRAAAAALARLGDRRSIRVLAKALEKWSGDASTTCELVQALTAWEDPAATPGVGRFLVIAAAALPEEAGKAQYSRFFLDLSAPETGLECALRWVARLRRAGLKDKVNPFLTGDSPRHRALAEAVLDRLEEVGTAPAVEN